MLMESVFTLHHVHVFTSGHEDVKFIGVYQSQALAEMAINRLKGQPGFADDPDTIYAVPVTSPDSISTSTS